MKTVSVCCEKHGREWVIAVDDDLPLCMQVEGPGLASALRQFADYLEDLIAVLTKDEGRLGRVPQRQLDWLRKQGIEPSREMSTDS